MGSLAPAVRVTILAAALCGLIPSSAAAATHVANPAAADGAAGSLRQLVTAAGATDTIELPPGTYRLSLGPLSITQGLTLEGQGDRAAQVVITAEGRSRAISAAPGAGGAVFLRRLQVSGGRSTGAAGNGAGILKTGAGSLELNEVTLSGNTTAGSPGGGGLAISAGAVTLRRSAVVNNSAAVTSPGGGAGILHSSASPLALENVTIAGNALTVTGATGQAGGSGLLTTTGAASLHSVSIAYNTTTPGALGALRNNGGGLPTLVNSLISNNGGNCAGALDSNGFNIDGDNSCSLSAANNDQPRVIAGIEQLADNGGPTPTLRLPPASLAINTGTCGPGEDQRNAARPAENETLCDVGAVEFEGWAKVEVPPCSRSGRLPFSIFSPRETGVEALDYTVDGGNPLTPLRVPVSGGSSATGTVNIPEGRRRLEYWADSFPTGTERGVQLKHSTPLVVVDRTNPRVAIANPNPFRVFVIKRRANVDVTATDSISGLVLDPSGTRPLDTSRRGSKTFAAGAVDLCTNQATAPFGYRVLAPGLGVRTVLERVKGQVRIRPAGGASSARASQKGRSFTAIREPREVVIGSLVDTRKGTVRLTSSANARTGIQDSEFAGGLFQVLQSRRRSAKALTEVRMKGSSFSSCSRTRGKRASAAARRVIRRLRGKGRGRFRTRGRYSAATVRGTTWTVEDRCDGTLTRVTRGRVAVRDFRRRRTITVRAGKSYLARAPR